MVSHCSHILIQLFCIFFLNFLLIECVAEDASQTVATNPKRTILAFNDKRLLETSTNYAVSRLVFGLEGLNEAGNDGNREGVEGKKKKPSLCKCSAVNLCEKLGRAEITFCQRKCMSHLSSFGDFVKIRDCFAETQQELELWSNCMKKRGEGFCSTTSPSNQLLSTQFNSFTYSINETYTKFLNTNTLTTQFRKARRIYTQFRSYQHCFNHCAKRAEEQCLLSNGCRSNYPSEAKQREIFDNCDGLYPKALHSAFNTCECLLEKKRVVKLTGVCEQLSNRFLMTVL